MTPRNAKMLPKCDDLMKKTPESVKMTPRNGKMLPKYSDLMNMTPEKVKINYRSGKMLPKCDDLMKMPRWGWSAPALCYTTGGWCRITGKRKDPALQNNNKRQRLVDDVRLDGVKKSRQGITCNMGLYGSGDPGPMVLSSAGLFPPELVAEVNIRYKGQVFLINSGSSPSGPYWLSRNKKMLPKMRRLHENARPRKSK